MQIINLYPKKIEELLNIRISGQTEISITRSIWTSVWFDEVNLMIGTNVDHRCDIVVTWDYIIKQ